MLNTDTIESLLRDHYFPESSIRSVEPVDGHQINSRNFKVTIEQDGKPSHYLLKCFPDAQWHSQKTDQISIWQQLAEAGAPLVPLVLTQGRELVTEEPRCVLMPFIQATTHYPEPDRWSQIAAETLARLENTIEKHTEETLFCPERSQAYRRPAPDDALNVRLQPFCNRFGLAHTALDDYKYALERASRFFAEQVRPIPNTLQHHDFLPTNLVIATDGTPFIIDIDSLYVMPSGQSSAYAALRFCMHSGQKSSVLDRFLESYRQKKIGVPGWKSREEALLFASFEVCARISFILHSWEQNGDDQWFFELDKHLSHLKWIDTHGSR